ncbi:MAG TPA: DUF5663 domain-containing protein [Candidatus Saccharimonadales bacterium]|nr:DUF5663 domain-containing protein [Candidatus Saccharimonadales bacterium]
MQTDDPNLLEDLDLSSYSPKQAQAIAQNIYAALEDRVGDQVANLISDEQFDQYEVLIDQADDQKLDQWLDANVPNYDQLVEITLQSLKQEFQANPTAFLASLENNQNELTAPV